MYNLTSKARGLLCKQAGGLVSIPVHPSLVVTKLSARAITWFPHSFGLGLSIFSPAQHTLSGEPYFFVSKGYLLFQSGGVISR